MPNRKSQILKLATKTIALGVVVLHVLECRGNENDAPSKSLREEFLANYCFDCHSGSAPEADLALDKLDPSEPSLDLHRWEGIIRKLRSRQMPPIDAERPSEQRYEEFLDSLESELDLFSQQHPDPGHTPALRRLTRTEYQNAIRDLLCVQIDAKELLLEDSESLGFDNITVTGLSPFRMERFLAAADVISRLAVGTPLTSPRSDSYRVPADRTQERRLEGLPLGTRGGTLFDHHFPRDGEYVFEFRLARDRNEEVEGLSRTHEIELLIDRESVQRFTIEPPRDQPDHQNVDAHLRIQTKVNAGPHSIGVTFIEDSSSLIEIKRQPYQSQFNMHRHPRSSPALFQVMITGPVVDQGPGDTPSRRRIFGDEPDGHQQDEASAKQILRSILRRAYRRPINDADLVQPMRFFREGMSDGGFEKGIQQALSAVLVNPNFLFRVERSPSASEAVDVHQISDVELASRLSFFLWSSLPDDELLALAEQEELSRPEVLDAQVRRMLADPKAHALATNFASQWLQLRNLQHASPNQRLFVDFDENLRDALRRETELHFAAMVMENKSVLELIRSDSTYLNERLAKHYGIPNVIGSRFRLVELDPEFHRGGLLRQGSIQTVTSYATRTSPVIRGNWILENLIGTPAPPPPADVPSLEENSVDAGLPLRERLMQHRADPSCSGCHNLMDPIGFSLENYDAIGRWRSVEHGHFIDAAGSLPDGSEFVGVEGLESAILKRPDLFVHTLTEKLMTYSLGREIRPQDASAIRGVLRAAKQDDYRFSSLIYAIVSSVPFQMRTIE